MKKHLSKKALWQSLLSVITLGIFILLAVGSLDMLEITSTTLLDDGRYEETFANLRKNVSRTITGKRDAQGRWNGQVTIEYASRKGSYTEEAHMAYGMRQGISTRTYPSGRKVDEYYINNILVDFPTKAARGSMADVSAFQILNNKYPWFLFALNASDFDSLYVEAYMDTVEILLNTYEFEITDFNSYYEDVLNVLEETPYDSIILLNSNLFLSQGFEELKNAELRLAVIDRYRSNGNTTYNIVTNTYPGYLITLNDSGVVNQDFEKFCQDLDDSLTSYGPLDPEDPFFVDSVDSHFFRAISSIMAAEESSYSLAKLSMKSAFLAYKKDDIRDVYKKVNSILKLPSLKSSSAEVALVVYSDMLIHFIQGDILRRAVREACFIRKGVISIPTVGTVFEGNNSATSVTLQGYVIEDGGADVTSRGIAWAAFYNPTVNDNPVTSGTGTGDFTITLTELTEGTTYYARTYATNSAGTAYGNCIGFIATGPTSVNDSKIFTRDFSIYPNPSSALTTFSFQLESSASMELTILDMKGQMVFQKNLDNLPQGENKIKLNLSDLQNGMYSCQLTDGTAKVTRKLVIAR